MTEVVEIENIKILKTLYPRDDFNNEIVNNYALNIENLPPITLSKNLILIDGYHRLLAHKLKEKTKIKAEFMDCPEDQILWEATKYNSKHGLQLSYTEKRRLARHFFQNNDCLQKEIADVLNVSPSAISNWLQDLVQEAKEEQKHQIIKLYLQCLTYEEISEKISVSIGKISNIFTKCKNEFSENPIIPESLQLFNVWYFPKRAKQYGLDFEGAIPGQIVENVLYYYTDPFDIIVDPMAGSGTTIDVCKAMYRRYIAYDLNPKREDITKNDIQKGFPKECNNCDLIFLDPPYFNMVFENLFQDIDDFYTFISKLAQDSFKTVRKGGIVAFLIEDMTEKGTYCLSGDSYIRFRDVGFEAISHISCPLTTQQFNPQQIEKAKEEKHLLGRNRDLYIFRKTL